MYTDDNTLFNSSRDEKYSDKTVENIQTNNLLSFFLNPAVYEIMLNTIWLSRRGHR
jgi:hypothetical protein